MFLESSVVIKECLAKEEFKLILNIGSSDRQFFQETQPFIWSNVMLPLYKRGNALINIDIKDSPGVHIVSDGISLPDIKVDWILCLSLLEHVSNPREFIRNASTRLKTGSGAILECPAVYPYHEDPIDNTLRLITRQDWEQFLDGLGFEIERFETIGSKLTTTLVVLRKL